MEKLSRVITRAREERESRFRLRYRTPVLAVLSVLDGELRRRPAPERTGSTRQRVLRKSGRSGGSATMSYVPPVLLDEPSEEPVVTPVGRMAEVRKRDGRLPGSSIVVGRTRPCDVVVPDYTISARHCALEPRGPGRWTLRDLGSTNGSSLDGSVVPVGRSVQLLDGQLLRLGRIACVFLTPAGLWRFASDAGFRSRYGELLPV